VAPSAGSGWAGRRATATAHPPERVGERLRGRAAGSTVGCRPKVRLVGMGAMAHLRWVTMVAVASLAAAAPAGAQSSASPDAAPSASQGASPDPAPVKSNPKVVVRAAPRPVAAATTTVRPVTPAATTPSPAVTTKPARRATTRRATTRRKKPARQERHEPAQPRRRAQVALPALPHLTLAHLNAPSTTGDDGRARKLAVGALSLLVLALASATLLAFTARVERRRMVR
jgi:hypothetical protein